LAREIAAITGKPWEPIILHPENCINNTGGVTVALDTPNCPRYIGRLIEGIRVKRSPLWLMSRLSLLGMRPINNIVDLTNYVMLLTGQPIHAFDADKLGKTIIVRQARENESIITLDEEERKLSSEIMMIATPEQSVAIAGVMGGINTEVDNDTRNILVEVAYFSPSSVRRAKKIVELNTESSVRFERGVDPQVPPIVADIVAYYAEQLADAQTIHTSVDEYPHPVEPDLITLTSDKVKRLLGINIPTDDTRRILVCLGFDIVSQNAGGVTYEVPPFRPYVTCESDLVEEVGRIYGLDLIEPLLRAQGPIPPNIPDEIKFDHFLQSYIAGLGFRYAFCDPLGNRSLLGIFAEKPLVELSNPISKDLAVMRPNPLPTLIAAVARNLNRGFRSVRMFEIDFGYYVENEYIEKKFVTLVCGGMRNPIGWNSTDELVDLYDIKGVVETIGKELDVNFEMDMIELPYAKPRTSLSVKIATEIIGYI
jgi:phenylalanyl-tRNA synthetase beta chain